MTFAEALRVAAAAEVPLRRPQQLVAVWLAALTWPADTRWRACGANAPSDAVFALLSSLSAHVTALRVAADPRAAGAVLSSTIGSRLRRLNEVLQTHSASSSQTLHCCLLAACHRSHR